MNWNAEFRPPHLRLVSSLPNALVAEWGNPHSHAPKLRGMPGENLEVIIDEGDAKSGLVCSKSTYKCHGQLSTNFWLYTAFLAIWCIITYLSNVIEDFVLLKSSI